MCNSMRALGSVRAMKLIGLSDRNVISSAEHWQTLRGRAFYGRSANNLKSLPPRCSTDTNL